jgi:hypothetical protein
MLAILAEFLSTIGMILLAGEYLQGRSRWFNRFLERNILRVVLIGFYVRNYPVSDHPLLVAKKLIRSPRRYLPLSIPLFVSLLVAVSFIDTSTQLSLSVETDAALASPDPAARDRARQVLFALGHAAVECIPMVASLENITDAVKKQEAAAEARACFQKWRYSELEAFHYLSIWRRIWILLRTAPAQLLWTAVAIVFIISVVSYSLCISLSISRLYTRLLHIDSFILPIGFLFAAIGQIMKLVSVLF